MKVRDTACNRGFSLVELIVVILIMGVLTAGAAVGFSAVYNADAERAANRAMSLYSVARSKAVALEDSGNIRFKLYKDTDQNYYAEVYGHDGTLIEPKQIISNRRLTVSVAKKNKTVGLTHLSNVGDYLEVRFEKSTGGIKSVNVNGTEYNRKVDGEEEMYKDLIFSGSEEYWMIMVPSTGKGYLK